MARKQTQLLTEMAQKIEAIQEELAAARARLAGNELTVRELVDRLVEMGLRPGATYPKALARLLDGDRKVLPDGSVLTFNGIGDLRVSTVTEDRIKLLRDDARDFVGHKVVAAAAARHRLLAVSSADGHGYIPADEIVWVAHETFGKALRADLIARDPSADVHGLPVHESSPRPVLSHAQMDQLRLAARLRCNDPDLALWVLDLSEVTGVRRTALCRLQLGHLQIEECRILFTEKYGRFLVLPVAAATLRELAAFARERGAVAPTDTVLRSRRHRPIVKSQIQRMIGDRIKPSLRFLDGLDCGTHAMRKHTVNRIGRDFGGLMAEVWSSHADGRELTRAHGASYAYRDLAYYTSFECQAQVAEYEFGPLDGPAWGPSMAIRPADHPAHRRFAPPRSGSAWAS